MRFKSKACLEVFPEAFCVHDQTIQDEIFQFGKVTAQGIFSAQKTKAAYRCRIGVCNRHLTAMGVAKIFDCEGGQTTNHLQ